MSHDHAAADAHAPAHAHDEPHGTLRDYVVGFLLSVVLTAIPFWLVMTRPLPDGATAAVILALAATQMIVHIIFFLHMNGKAEGGWTLTALVFAIIVIVITMAGSLWVMYHLNTNMMPAHAMSRLP